MRAGGRQARRRGRTPLATACAAYFVRGICRHVLRPATGGSSSRSTENGAGATDAREHGPPVTHSWRLQQIRPRRRRRVARAKRTRRAARGRVRPSRTFTTARAPSPRHQRVGTKLPSTNYHPPTIIYQLPSTNYQLSTTNYQLLDFRIVTAPAGRRPTRSRRRSRPPRPSASVLPHRPAPSGRTPRADASAAVPFLGLQL